MLKVKSRISYPVLLRQLIFLCIPTVVLAFILLKAFGGYFSVFNNVHFKQTIYFSLGLFISCFFHSFRFRFLPAFLGVLALFWGVAFIFDRLVTGEFDSFFISIEIIIFRSLFVTGWLCGWGYSRIRWFPAFFSGLLLLIGLIVISKLVEVSFYDLSLSFAPLIFFSFYIIYTAELIRNSADQQTNNWKFWKTLISSAALIALLIASSIWVFSADFKSIEREWLTKSSLTDDKNSMFKRSESGGQQLKDKLSLQDKQSRGSGGGKLNLPLYVVYLDNFFSDSNQPNPLYYVVDYFTKFDNYTETFEPDPDMPSNDLFSPNPANIPLYFSSYDSTVLINGRSNVHRRVVETEVYKINAAVEEFAAPTTAFFCQPIAVKSELQDQFKSAYRAKMWISDLNSAYLVYNNTKRDWKLQAFQEQRFEVLRTVEDFNNVPADFLNYYTQLPENATYDTIKSLAQLIVKKSSAENPMDQILAIRDFYMEADDEGKSIFQYTDTPGPVPSGSRLLHFLLTEKKGYCAHFAGSTLFLLRALGIPSRLAVGYAVVDRSSNNKGWYWIYEKQAHAWVQVFFPEYGWLDFDTTFGDEEQEEAPSSDGTPPLEPQKAWFAGTGSVLDIDTIQKQIVLDMNKMMFNDLEYKFETGHKIKLDLSLAKINKDSLIVSINKINKGDQALNISFSDPNINFPTIINPQDIQMILSYFPIPVAIDQVFIETNQQKKPDPNPSQEQAGEQASNWTTAFWILLGLFLLICLLIFLAPYGIYRLYRHKAKRIKDAQTEAYYPYRASVFLLHQMGICRVDQTPLQYARSVDQQLGTSFESFTAVYLKAKYAGQSLSADELERVFTFYRAFEQLVRSKISFKRRLFLFLNIYNTLDYFTKE